MPGYANVDAFAYSSKEYNVTGTLGSGSSLPITSLLHFKHKNTRSTVTHMVLTCRPHHGRGMTINVTPRAVLHLHNVISQEEEQIAVTTGNVSESLYLFSIPQDTLVAAATGPSIVCDIELCYYIDLQQQEQYHQEYYTQHEVRKVTVTCNNVTLINTQWNNKPKLSTVSSAANEVMYYACKEELHSTNNSSGK